MSQIQFEQYYKNNYDALSSFAYMLAKNKMEADDLVQETAIKAYNSFHKFMEGSSFKNWTFTILKNTFITKYTKRKKRNVVSLPVEEMEFATLQHTTIEDKTEQKESVLLVKKGMETLTKKSRLPLDMYLNGYQYDEISENLDIPLGTVKSRINYARTKLKEWVQSKKK